MDTDSTQLSTGLNVEYSEGFGRVDGAVLWPSCRLPGSITLSPESPFCSHMKSSRQLMSMWAVCLLLIRGLFMKHGLGKHSLFK